MTAVISIFGQKGSEDNTQTKLQRYFVSPRCAIYSAKGVSRLTVICRFAAEMGFIRLVTVILSVLLAGKGLFMLPSYDIVFVSCEFLCI